MNATEVTLPTGLFHGQAWHRKALLRPLNGDDEAFLAEDGRFLLPARRTTALLSRVLLGLGRFEQVSEQMVGALTVGDRDALMLHLRRATIGGRISCVLRCPDSTCAEMMDLDLDVDDLLAPSREPELSTHEAIIEEATVQYVVSFRLPTGADQEAASTAAIAKGVERARALLIERCVESVVGGDIETPEPSALVALGRALPRLMAELDPQAELRLDMSCSACRKSFSIFFDPAAHFFEELEGTVDELYQQIHFLAYHYHWSEEEILSLPTRRRRRYVENLSEAAKKRGTR